jgi:hypothetical protein
VPPTDKPVPAAGQPIRLGRVDGGVSSELLSRERSDAAGVSGIEALHWIRDTLYREDNSTAHTGSGPRTMATLRNLAIGAIRLFGRNDITETTRWAHRDMRRPFHILGLT